MPMEESQWTHSFFQTTSSPNPVYLWVSEGLGGIPELNFKGSWCKNEALGVLRAEKSKIVVKFASKMPICANTKLDT